jgi:hypothetical protein
MERPKLELADVLRRYDDSYRAQHETSLSSTQRRVMQAITACRTAALGGHLEACDDCGHQRIAYNSCRNRHCPKCQSLARAQWIEDRKSELLDCPYFHVVFTLPEEIAAIAYQNKAVVYNLLFAATADTLRTIAADPRHLGAEIGFFAVLHTWGQTLVHHPHLHCVVPGGGLSADGQRWIACRPGFFLPVRVLSRFFRRRFLERLEQAFDRKPGKSGARRFASGYRTSHSSVVHIDSVLGVGVQVPPRNRNAVPDTDGQKNHVAACGEPGKWPDVDFGALLQGRRCQSSFHRSSSAKLCKVRGPSYPTKIGVGCFSYA